MGSGGQGSEQTFRGNSQLQKVANVPCPPEPTRAHLFLGFEHELKVLLFKHLQKRNLYQSYSEIFFVGSGGLGHNFYHHFFEILIVFFNCYHGDND